MRIFVAHSSDFDFRAKLYEPLRESALDTEHEFILPQEDAKEVVTKEIIGSCDAFVADVSMPSFGAGIELGWADAAGVPVICMYEKGSCISSALQFVTDTFIEYESPDELIEKLTAALAQL